MFSFGFYNSRSGDRKYNAAHMGKIFDGVIQDGVFGTIHGTDKTPFQISAASTPGLTAVISQGKAWLDHTWNYLDNDANLAFNSVQSGKKRTDAVCIQINASYSETGYTPRTNGLIIVEGSPVSDSIANQKPDLTAYQKKNSAGETIIWQYPLAYVTIYGSTKIDGNVTYNANAIEAQNVETAIGPENAADTDKYKTWTPLVTGATLDTSDYIPSLATIEARFNSFIDTESAEFNEWFDKIIGAIVGEFVEWTGETFYDFITYYTYDSQTGQYTPVQTPVAGNTYYVFDTSSSLVELNDKIDTKIQYGTSSTPPSTLKNGDVYFQIEG